MVQLKYEFGGFSGSFKPWEWRHFWSVKTWMNEWMRDGLFHLFMLMVKIGGRCCWGSYGVHWGPNKHSCRLFVYWHKVIKISGSTQYKQIIHVKNKTHCWQLKVKKNNHVSFLYKYVYTCSSCAPCRSLLARTPGDVRMTIRMGEAWSIFYRRHLQHRRARSLCPEHLRHTKEPFLVFGEFCGRKTLRGCAFSLFNHTPLTRTLAGSS